MVTGRKTDLHTFLNSSSSFGEKHLALVLREDRIIIGLSDHDSTARIDSYEIAQPAGELRSLFALIGKDFKYVSAYSSDPRLTLIPDKIFDKAHSKDYLDAVFGASRCQALSKPIDALGLHAAFVLDKPLFEELHEVFPQVQIHHSLEPLLIQSWISQSFTSQHLFRLHLIGRQLFVMVFEGKQLCLYNSYSTPEDTDIAYHVLNSIQALKVDYDQADVQCSGDLRPGEAGYALLASYCPAIKHLGAESSAERELDFTLLHHRYCES